MRVAVSLLLAGTALAACAPAERPLPTTAALPAMTTWRDPLPSNTVPVEPSWWHRLGDPALVPLVERAVANNVDVLTAVARVEEAEAAIRLTRAGRLPTLDASGAGGAQRSLSQITGLGTNSVTVQPQLSAAWNLDLFGRVRALEGAARAQYRATQADRDAARLSVVAATVRAYVSLLSLDAQLDVTRNTLVSRREALRIAEDRARTGYSSQLELTQSQSEFEAIVLAIPQLEQARRVQENALRELTGDPPGAVVRGKLPAIQLPAVPAALPAELLRRRPDIAAAELRLAAADQTIASRRAEYLPDVQLSASGGALFVDGLDWDPVSIWSLGASILAPIFQGGALRANLDTATAQRDQAAFAYRGATIGALGEVDNAFSGERTLRERFDAALRRRAILQRSLGFATDRYRGGYAAYLEQLDAQRNLYQVELDAIAVREEQINNLVTLWAALGGGWQAAGEQAGSAR
ncbi:efflux transporter outer membrane subunit [Sphingomonas sp. PL-96]|uniref:efflux transporter outer membrane subunit n=1 Tax=Sphingomonas sp. PL-96 TaxID=2887201 RepID=UPI001E5965D3|nr:efflux transporter outer membrane subunit [Sphingomonas sp. PL-96]MCC2978040.1 efflux transporter outer membrane subunit [Sphingomonas sp. PL-96]